MTVFHADLDNTLIYSWKHEIGERKVCAEIYEGREISFMTCRASSLLKRIREKAVLVPTTTRTREQYDRIDLKTGRPDYALICNGGVLLKADEEVPGWYEGSLELIKKSREGLIYAEACMRQDPDRIFEVRNIRGLFLFTKSCRPPETMKRLEEALQGTFVDVLCNGSKIYAVPRGLDKGTALRRFREYIKADFVIAAGDSAFDIPMLEAADLAYAPETLLLERSVKKQVRKIGQGVFSDEMLHMVLSELSMRERDSLVPGALQDAVSKRMEKGF